MSTTPTEITRASRRQEPPSLPPSPAAVAPPPKLRRRPLLIAVSIAAICLGALVSVWAYTATSTTHEILAVRQTVHRGQTITREDLMTVQIGVDPALNPLPGSALESVVGQRAAMDLPAGGVVTPEQVTPEAIPAKGTSVVGISLAAAMVPADQLRVGDRVRVVTTPGEQGEITATAPEAISATVVGVTRDATTNNTIVNVQVAFADAPLVAARAATGKVAVILDSQER